VVEKLMTKPEPAKDTTRKTGQESKPCADDFKPKPELDGKNDSGPDPEIHGREIPPQ
jgi:hypothetical protein